MPELPDCVNRMSLRSLGVLSACDGQTDRQTDGRTDTQPVVKSRCSIAECDKKWMSRFGCKLVRVVSGKGGETINILGQRLDFEAWRKNHSLFNPFDRVGFLVCDLFRLRLGF